MHCSCQVSSESHSILCSSLRTQTSYNRLASPCLALPCLVLPCICIAAVRSSQLGIVCSDHHLNRCCFNSACRTVQNGACLPTEHGAVSALTSVLDLRIRPARDICSIWTCRSRCGQPISTQSPERPLLVRARFNLTAVATSNHSVSAAQHT